MTTDGHRLAHIEKVGEDHGDLTGEKKTLIPRKALSELSSLLGSADDKTSTMDFADDDSTLFFRVGGRVLTSRKLTGQFPTTKPFFRAIITSSSSSAPKTSWPPSSA